MHGKEGEVDTHTHTHTHTHTVRRREGRRREGGREGALAGLAPQLWHARLHPGDLFFHRRDLICVHVLQLLGPFT